MVLSVDFLMLVVEQSNNLVDKEYKILVGVHKY